MSTWSRLANVFRRDRLRREIDEELRSHMEEAVANGRDPEEARRAFGSALQLRERSADIKAAAWLDSLRADLVFASRQLRKRKAVSAAAILSLALAAGASLTAFRLIDALLYRPLPVAGPDRIYALRYVIPDPRTGQPITGASYSYPLFRELREAARGQAELLVVSTPVRIDLAYSGGAGEIEKATRQWVSGSLFSSFGLQPALGRLLTAEDDRKAGGGPYAVLSHDYWIRRFDRDPRVIGRTFRMGTTTIEIVGVAPAGFTGTSPGTFTDLFLPATMNARSVDQKSWQWFSILAHLRPGVPPDALRDKLHAIVFQFRMAETQGWDVKPSPQVLAALGRLRLLLDPAPSGTSWMQRDYEKPLAILAIVVALVLLIACANVANLMTAQAAARAREMALRVSIGAGRGRLVQLVLVECVLVATLAAALGGFFSAWAAPSLVTHLRFWASPAQLQLPVDFRLLAFAALLTLGVTVLFGLGPALRASSVRPSATLRGGEDPRGRRHVMHTLIAAQVAFCFLVHFVAGLFVSTFDRLAHQPTGFAAERVLTLEANALREQPIVHWNQALDHLRSTTGVEAAALCGWPLLSGNSRSNNIWVDGRTDDDPPYFLPVTAGFFDTMGIPLLGGRDFRPDDQFPMRGIVNEAFARRYFDGRNPVGRTIEVSPGQGKRAPLEIVGYVRDTRYQEMREAMHPTVFIPFTELDAKGAERGRDWATFVVRTSSAAGNPLNLAPALRREVPRARSELRVSDIHTQTELVEQHTVRERLLAALSLFFALVALLLSGVGLYGVLNYSVLQRRREIGIRLALGAPAREVARRILAEIALMLTLGAATGLAAGIAGSRYLETLLYQVKATDLTIIIVPVLTILAAAVLASLPPLWTAIRIDPMSTLRTE